MLLEQAIIYLQAGVDGLCEAVLLAFYDASYILLLFAQLGILAFVFVNNGVNDLIKERFVNAKELTMARSSSEKSAQDIASPSFDGRMPSQIINVALRIWSVITRRDTSRLLLSP